MAKWSPGPTVDLDAISHNMALLLRISVLFSFLIEKAFQVACGLFVVLLAHLRGVFHHDFSWCFPS